MTLSRNIHCKFATSVAVLLFPCLVLPCDRVVAAVGEVGAAEQVVADVVDTVMPIIREQRERFGTDMEFTEQVMHAHVIPSFDVDTISRWVLAKHWRRLEAGQREEFTDSFVDMLVRTYGGQLTQYVDSEVVITGSSLADRKEFALVNVTIKGGERDGLKIKYRMRQQDDGSWQIMDVVVEGISILANFRSVMGDIISSEGFDVLLRRMRDGNDFGSKKLPGE